MGKKYDFDYLIIGGGPAGQTVAMHLAGKKSVAIVDEQPLGGSDLNARDIPYSINLDFAHTFTKFANYPQISGKDLHFNFPTILTNQSRIVNSLRQEDIACLIKADVKFLSGHAHFLDAHTVAVGTEQYTAANFIIATGSILNPGDILGSNYLTPTTALRIRKLPKNILVVGGGSTGCEIAAYFAELGTKVILIEASNRLLPKEDPETGIMISEYFTKKLGINIVNNAKVIALEQNAAHQKVILKLGNQEKFLRAETVVLATGARPYLDCGLENAGVKYKNNHIIANKFFQTSVKHIYAIGDCIGSEISSTELVQYQASVLANNLLQKTKKIANYQSFVRLTNTYPEVATIGSNEIMLKSQGGKYKTVLVHLSNLPAAKITRLEHGFVKLISDRNHRILGATIVAPNAHLMAEEISLAIQHCLTVSDIANTPHITNSFNQAIKLAAAKLAIIK